MATDFIKQHEFLDAYLQYVENTETPRLMHIWSAVGSASASMGRHVYLPFGNGKLWPNMFILLVGPPGTRKSSGLNYSAKLVRKYTNLRFAPDDTGSQRQGLIAALEGDIEDADIEDKEIESKFEIGMSNVVASDIDIVADLDVSLSNGSDKHFLFAAASEFGTFMGESNVGMTRLLNKVWDGEDYNYRLKAEQKVLTDALMTIVGATTSAEIVRILPPDAIGQGFMSRWIFVFAPKKEKRISRPTINPIAGQAIGDTFGWLYSELKGEMKETKSASNALDDLYMEGDVKIQDSRFIFYVERRHTHLMKLAMVLAASRRSKIIELKDVDTANALLTMTEQGMPDALGEFGLSPVANAKQKMLEFLQHVQEPISNAVLWSVMSRDMKLVDYKTAITDLVNKKKVLQINTQSGIGFVYIDDLSGVMDDLLAD